MYTTVFYVIERKKVFSPSTSLSCNSLSYIISLRVTFYRYFNSQVRDEGTVDMDDDDENDLSK